MPIITKISTQKNSAERFNIELDGKFAFGVDAGVLVQYQMAKGMELDELAIAEIQYEDQVRKAFSRALHFLEFRMRSEGEVREKLAKLEYGELVIEEAVRKLTALGFLDDRAFSKALLETKKKSGGKGPAAIRQELKRKGIEKELQNEVMESYSEEEQVEIARRLAEKAAARQTSYTPQQMKQKVHDALLRKGYSYAVISLALEEVSFEKGEEEMDDLVKVQGEKLWKKYEGKLKGRNLRYKVSQALYQKGFNRALIDRFLDGKEQGE